MPELSIIMRKIFALAICAVLVLIIYAYAIDTSRTVALNLAFNIADENDSVSRGNDYISSERNNFVVAIVSSSKTFAVSNHSYSATQYMLRMNQTLEDNRFLITLTNGTNQTIREKLDALGNRKILGTTFGTYTEPAISQFPLFIRLQYEDINILTRIRSAGNTRLIMRNEGKEDGLTKIALEVV